MTQASGAAVHDRMAVELLVDRLNEPRTAAALNSLLDQVELLAVIVSGLDGLARKGEIIGDTLAEVLAELRAAGDATGLDLRKTSTQLATLIPALAEAAPTITRIVESPIAAPEPIAVLSEAAEALVKGLTAAQQNQTKVGLGGLMKSLRDDDVRRGLGFIIEVLRVFGSHVPAVQVGEARRA